MKMITFYHPYCEKNEKSSKRFLKKLHEVTDDLYKIKIKWIIKNLFRLNSKNLHPAGVIYEGICTCKENYTGETKRNVEIRWEKHSDINKIYEPPSQLKSNATHSSTCNVLMVASINDCVRKNLIYSSQNTIIE